MTREELLADIDRATNALASRAAQNTTSGVPRPPNIEVSESTLETEPFHFELDSNPTAEAAPGTGGGGGTPSEWACCHDDTCDDMTLAECDDVGGTYHVGEHCDDDPDPCAEPLPDCPCGFSAFDGSGRMFLTMVITRTDTSPPCCDIDNNTCGAGHSGTQTITLTYDPDTCVESSERDKITATNCDGSTGDIDATACASLITDDATHQHCDATTDPWCSEMCPAQSGANEQVLNETRTLLDECNPI